MSETRERGALTREQQLEDAVRRIVGRIDHPRRTYTLSTVQIAELRDILALPLPADGAMPVEPRYFDNDGYICETGVKPKFVLKEDHDALRAHCADLTRQLAAAREEALDAIRALRSDKGGQS